MARISPGLQTHGFASPVFTGFALLERASAAGKPLLALSYTILRSVDR